MMMINLKNMKEIIQALITFAEKEIAGNKLVRREKFEYERKPVAAPLISVQRELKRIEHSILDFYEISNGIEIIWKAADPEMLHHEMTGIVKLNPFSQVVKDWRDRKSTRL